MRQAAPLACLDLAISHIGSAGDGAATMQDRKTLHIPRTLPGEIVRTIPKTGRASLGTLEAILRPSADRVLPPCRHFGLCGGCALQHWDDAAYSAWKRDLVVRALKRAGFTDPDVAALIRTPPHARRRIDLAAARRDGGVTLGLHRAHATDIVDLAECVIMHPALFALLGPLRTTLSSLAALRRTGSVLANLLDTGADLLLRTDGPLAPSDRTKLAAFAQAHAIGRIAWALGSAPPEIAALLNTGRITFAGQGVEPPPGAFLQASAEGEAAIVSAVLAGLPHGLNRRSRAIELFAGCGTISFPLAERLRVTAYEGDAGAAAAIRRALSGTHVEITHRDLARQPLSAKELSKAEVIVLDPPYTGAEHQMPAIAASGVARVIHVGCNPAVLTRDLAILARAGYRLLQVTPIDQFLWSAHVESVSVLERL